jgi:aspartate aminotransferase
MEANLKNGSRASRRDGPDINLNLNVRGLKPSATLAINDRSNELLRQGVTIHKLGLGQSPFPVPEPVVQALRDNAPCKDYLPVQGLWQLRQAVSRYHWRVDGVPIRPNHVLIGPGSKELMFLVQLAFYGDLIVPAPCWVSYAPQTRIVGRHVRFIETSFEEGWRLTPQRLEEICQEDPTRPRLLILNYPGNPDGDSYGIEELQQLADIARHYQIVLLSDEIYGPLWHVEEHPHVSVARFYPEGTIISAGLSKWCGAGGWRLGTFSFPPQLEWLLEAMSSLASETFTSTSAPIQWAAIQAFDGSPEIEAYLKHARRILHSLGRWTTDKLREAGARLRDPKGAFYLFPDFEALRSRLEARGIENSRQLCARALDETGVAFLPGDDFGTVGKLTARLAYVDFDGAAALAASKQLGDQEIDESFLRTHCESVVLGIEKLCDWLS